MLLLPYLCLTLLSIFAMAVTSLAPDDLDSIRRADTESTVLRLRNIRHGKIIKDGIELRILPVGDSISVGFLSDRDGGDGSGYRNQLAKDLSSEKRLDVTQVDAGS